MRTRLNIDSRFSFGDINLPHTRQKLALGFNEIVIPCLYQCLKGYNQHKVQYTSTNEFIEEAWNELDLSDLQDYAQLRKVLHNVGVEYADPNVWSTQLFNLFNYLQGAEESLDLLSRFYDISIITNGMSELDSEVHHYTSSLFIDDIKGSFFPHISLHKDFIDCGSLISDVIYAKELKKKKSEICLEKGIKKIVDHDPQVAIDCANRGIEVILFRKPWNKGLSHKLVIECNNWQKICNYLLKDKLTIVPNVFIEKNRAKI